MESLKKAIRGGLYFRSIHLEEKEPCPIGASKFLDGIPDDEFFLLSKISVEMKLLLFSYFSSPQWELSFSGVHFKME